MEGNPLKTIDIYGLFNISDFITSPPVVNTIAGFGDGIYSVITLGFGDLNDIRDFFDIGDVDKSCPEYNQAATLGNVVGFGAASGTALRGSGMGKSWGLNLIMLTMA